MSSLLLRHLAYLGPDKRPASISFGPGLNVICGASETGKSFIVESIDFMLGGGELPRDLPERAGYDRVRLLIESAAWPPLTLERSVEGGNFRAYEQQLLDGEPEAEPRILRERHSAARQDTISHVLLERLNLTSKRLRKSGANDTRSLSFRDLARLSVVTEEEIQKRKSPLLSGQFTQATPEYATFKLLVTGVDDSALVADTAAEGRRESDAAKIEILSQLIDELQKEIDEAGLIESELTDQLSRLEAQIAEQNEALNQVQGVLNELLQTRAYHSQEIRRRRGRLDEIEELTKRFGLLGEHYQTDLSRLGAIQESGSLFVHLERATCPLCGAAAGDQHLDSDCDGNTEAVVLAASAEIGKIRQLRRELGQTVASLEQEKVSISAELAGLEEQYRQADRELYQITSPAVSAGRASYNQLVTKGAEVRLALEKFDRLDRLVTQRTELEAGDAEASPSTATRTQINKATLDDFSQTVERILTEWHYPNAARVFFDESKKDFQIAGKERGSTGKGLRAITHAAVSVALLEYCQEHDLPHPGFLVLDSPLLAYWKPEGAEDDLRGTDLKQRFYEYLLGLKSDRQVIIIENEHPPDFVFSRAHVTVFTKNPHQGRYGFFPQQ
jgi:hypothetical protein